MVNLPRVSLLIAARNEGDNLVDMVSCLLDNRGSTSIEIRVVDDGSTDGSGDRLRQQFGDCDEVSYRRAAGIGVAAARNLAAREARAEILVFLDGHCWCPPGWLDTLLAPLDEPGVGLVGPAFTDLVLDDAGIGCGVHWPQADLKMQWLEQPPGGHAQAVPLMPGGCDAIRRDLFIAIGGYDAGMGRWGSEGEELALRVWASGYAVHAVPDCLVRHLFRAQHPYAVDATEVLHNRLRLATVHFPDRQLARVFEFNRPEPNFEAALALLESSDAAQRRLQRSEDSATHVAAWFERFVTW